MARLYVDENSRFLLRPLRNAGHDVASAAQAGPGQNDFWHLRRASGERRVLITLDTGFYYVHGLWTALMTLELVGAHSGVLTAAMSRRLTADGWFAAISRRLTVDDDLSGRILTWHAEDGEWREDARPPWKGII